MGTGRTRRSGRVRVHRGFGLDFECAFDLPGLPAHPGPPDLLLELAGAEDVARAWSGPATEPAMAELTIDGLPYRVERGAAGDHLITHGHHAAFHVSADTRTVLAAPRKPDDPMWRRVLLDSVLATVSLLRGFEALHAAAVAGPSGAVAFTAGTGGGKTTLACELMRRGHPLVSDDILALTRDGNGRVMAHPAPPLITVPADAPVPDGERLATLDGETWMAARHAAASPVPVAGIVVLRRGEGLTPGVRPSEAGAIDLLGGALQSGDSAERMRRRFELFADLAAQAPVFVLEADPRTPPAHLADLAEQALPALQLHVTERA